MSVAVLLCWEMKWALERPFRYQQHPAPAAVVLIGMWQTISFIAHLRFVRHKTGPHLVIAPLTVVSTWVAEFSRACPELRVLKMHSSDMKEREELKKRVMMSVTELDVVVTTYGELSLVYSRARIVREECACVCRNCLLS